MAAPQKSRKSS